MSDKVTENFQKRCDECGHTFGLSEVEWHLLDGQMVSFGVNTTQEKLDSLPLICELCQEEKEEREYY